MHIGKMGNFFLLNCILKPFFSHSHPTLPHLRSLFSRDGNTSQHSFPYFPITSQNFKLLCAFLCRLVLLVSVHSGISIMSWSAGVEYYLEIVHQHWHEAAAATLNSFMETKSFSGINSYQLICFSSFFISLASGQDQLGM